MKPVQLTTPTTASMLYDFSRCPHRVVLDASGPIDQREAPNAFVELLWREGNRHEADVVAALPSVLNLRDAPHDQREAMTRQAMADRVPLIYGGRLSNVAEGLLGEPDLLRLHGAGYRAGDVKSGAGLVDLGNPASLRPEYALQVAHYTHILELEGLSDGKRCAFILDGKGNDVPYPLEAARGPRTPQTWWAFFLDTLQAVRDRLSGATPSRGAMSAACKLCHWRAHCKQTLIAADDLSLIAELGARTRDAIALNPEHPIPTVAALAKTPLQGLLVGSKTVFEGIGADTLARFRERAQLLSTPGAQPYLRSPVHLPRMPNEVLFDIEADPMRDLVYLHGFVQREHANAASSRFLPVLAEQANVSAEEAAFHAAWSFLSARSLDSVIYYYSPYERVAYRKLARKFPSVCSPLEVDFLFSLPTVIDLYHDVIRKSTEWPCHDQSIKSLAVYLGFKWRDANPSGAASIEWYHQWIETGDPALRQRILDYNEDDCLATGVVVDGVRSLSLKSSRR